MVKLPVYKYVASCSVYALKRESGRTTKLAKISAVRKANCIIDKNLKVEIIKFIAAALKSILKLLELLRIVLRTLN